MCPEAGQFDGNAEGPDENQVRTVELPSTHGVEPPVPPADGNHVACWMQRPIVWTGNGPSGWTPSSSFVKNLGLMLANLVLWSAWLLRYTESFEIVGGLVALSGFSVWLAFLIRVLPEERFKVLQLLFCDTVLESRMTQSVCVVPLVILLLLFCLIGTLQIESLPGTGAEVTITRSGSSDSGAEPLSLTAGKRIRSPRTAPLPWSSSFDVKVTGFPTKTVTIGPWQRRADLKVPYSFLRPVVLVGGKSGLVKAAEKNDLRIVITVNGKDYGRYYDGHAIWLGCDERMIVPGRVREAWSSELQADLVASKLLQPRVIDELGELRPGMHIEISVENKREPHTVRAKAELVIRPVRSEDDVVQEVLVK